MPCIAMCSPKGGAGKSTATVILATTLAAKGTTITIIDADPNRPVSSPHYSREMRDQSQTVDIVHNYANGLFDEVFCNEISSPGVWWPGPISGGPMNYSG